MLAEKRAKGGKRAWRVAEYDMNIKHDDVPLALNSRASPEQRVSGNVKKYGFSFFLR